MESNFNQFLSPDMLNQKNSFSSPQPLNPFAKGVEIGALDTKFDWVTFTEKDLNK